MVLSIHLQFEILYPDLFEWEFQHFQAFILDILLHPYYRGYFSRIYVTYFMESYLDYDKDTASYVKDEKTIFFFLNYSFNVWKLVTEAVNNYDKYLVTTDHSCIC